MHTAPAHSDCPDKTFPTKQIEIDFDPEDTVCADTADPQHDPPAHTPDRPPYHHREIF